MLRLGPWRAIAGHQLCVRPEGKRLFDILRAGDMLVVRWIDRLGRNYEDVTENIRRFMAMGVIVVGTGDPKANDSVMQR
jgi:DNA invertase Pin-like site-specific DNA recombinase